jgi:hypothetical protein
VNYVLFIDKLLIVSHFCGQAKARRALGPARLSGDRRAKLAARAKN